MKFPRKECNKITFCNASKTVKHTISTFKGQSSYITLE